MLQVAGGNWLRLMRPPVHGNDPFIFRFPNDCDFRTKLQQLV
jgi:hypothetical protein